MAVVDNSTISSYYLNNNFTDEEFLSLGPKEQAEIYRQANLDYRVSLVTRLNLLGMKQEVSAQPPAIISSCMDVATKHEIILGYLKQLRATNRLFTQEEFSEKFKKDKWVKKYSFDRLLGRDHLLNKISELGLNYFKVPQKLLVIKS